MVKFQKDKKNIAEALKKGLKRHRGAIKEIAERTGYTRQYVYCVLRGDYKNLSILSVAGKVFSEKEDEEAKIVASIQERVNAAS